MSTKKIDEIFSEELNRLFATAQQIDEFEFINVLLGYKGMGDPRAITHRFESEDLFNSLSKLLTGNIADKNEARIGLFLYCHFFEMGDLYSIIGNLMNITMHGHYNPWLYDEPDDDLYPIDKIAELEKIAAKSGFQELTKCFDETFYNRLRNSFFHSNYSIINDNYLIVSRYPIEIKGSLHYSLSISNFLLPLVNTIISFANSFFSIIKKYKLSYKSNKIIKGRFPQWEFFMILGDDEKGLIGFKGQNGSSIKLEEIGGEPFLAAYNMVYTVPDKTKKALYDVLNDLIEKNDFKKNDPRVSELETKIIADGDKNLKKGLGILFYNWGNNVAELAKTRENKWEKKALHLEAERLYDKALSFDTNLAMAIHNKGTNKLRISEIDGKATNQDRYSIYALFEKSIGLGFKEPFAFENAGRILIEIANAENDPQISEGNLNKAIEYLDHALTLEPEHCVLRIRIAICNWQLARLQTEEQKRHHNCEVAYKWYNEALVCDSKNYDNILSFASFLEYYAGINNSKAAKLLEEAIEVSNKAIQIVPEKAYGYYCKGNKLIRLGFCINEKAIALYEEATDNYRKAVSLDESDARYSNNLGFSLMTLALNSNPDTSITLYKEASSFLEKAVHIEPHKAESYYNLGIVNFNLYKITDEASFVQLSLENFIKAAELNTNCDYELMSIFSLLKDKGKTVLYFERYLSTGEKQKKIESIKNDPDLKFVIDLEEYKTLLNSYNELK